MFDDLVNCLFMLVGDAWGGLLVLLFCGLLCLDVLDTGCGWVLNGLLLVILVVGLNSEFLGLV